MKTLTFFVIRDAEGYYVATAQEESIITQGKNLDELVRNIDEAVSLHFEDENINSPYTVIFSSNVYASQV